jgi:hypothetical protein
MKQKLLWGKSFGNAVSSLELTASNMEKLHRIEIEKTKKKESNFE